MQNNADSKCKQLLLLLTDWEEKKKDGPSKAENSRNR